MSAVELLLVLALQAAPDGAPSAPDEARPVVSAAARPTTAVRLLAQAGAGLAVTGAAFAVYFGATSTRSPYGFFVGFAGATVLAGLAGPLAVHWVGRALGSRGGPGWTVLGAVLGVVAGVLIGLPLATVPSQAYVTGLGVLWVGPAAGALIASAVSEPAAVPALALVPGGAVLSLRGRF